METIKFNWKVYYNKNANTLIVKYLENKKVIVNNIEIKTNDIISNYILYSQYNEIIDIEKLYWIYWLWNKDSLYYIEFVYTYNHNGDYYNEQWSNILEINILKELK